MAFYRMQRGIEISQSSKNSCHLLAPYPNCRHSVSFSLMLHKADSFGTTDLTLRLSYFSREAKTCISPKNSIQIPGLKFKMDLCARVMRDLRQIFHCLHLVLFQISLRSWKLKGYVVKKNLRNLAFKGCGILVLFQCWHA